MRGDSSNSPEPDQESSSVSEEFWASKGGLTILEAGDWEGYESNDGDNTNVLVPFLGAFCLLPRQPICSLEVRR